MATGILLSFMESIWGYFTATSTTTYSMHYACSATSGLGRALEKGAHDYMIVTVMLSFKKLSEQ